MKPLAAHGRLGLHRCAVRLWAGVLLALALCAQAAQAQDARPRAWPRGQATPSLALKDLQGRTVRLQDYRGRPVLLNFWATWCGPCRAEMPTLQVLADMQGPEQLAVLMVNVKEPAATVRRFIAQGSLDLPVLLDSGGAAARQWGARIFPTTVLVGPDGRARWQVVGEVDWSSIAAERWVRTLAAD